MGTWAEVELDLASAGMVQGKGRLDGVAAHIEVLHGLGDIELVHRGDDDGWRGEEKEEDKEDNVDD